VPRRNRVHCPGGVYHVVARGVRRERIFYRSGDYRTYLGLLRQTCDRYGVRVVAYVLMPNHVHLLVRVGEVPLSRAMQFLQGRFAQWYNRRYGYSGHVFQGRYSAKLCEDERYLWALVRYIHANPVRAGLSGKAEAYRWSSVQEYRTERWRLVSEAEACKLLGPPDRVVLAGA
jgi:REP element-mobilizing transposase RayT